MLEFYCPAYWCTIDGHAAQKNKRQILALVPRRKMKLLGQALACGLPYPRGLQAAG